MKKTFETIARLLPKGRTPKPATAKEIAALEKLAPIHDDLAALLAWCGNWRIFDFDGIEWLDARLAAGIARDLRKIESFPKTLLPIATDGAGNYACIDGKTGAIRDWDHETRKVTAITRDLESYLDKNVVRPAKEAAQPKSAKVKRLLGRIARGADLFDIFGDALFDLTEADPKAALGVLDAVEARIAASGNDFGTDKLLEARTRCFQNLKQPDAAWDAYQKWLVHARTSGSLERPILIEAGFAKMRKKEWAADAAEVTAMDETYLLYQYLSAASDERAGPRKKAVRELIESADELLTESGKDERARMLACKAAALALVGQTGASKRAWAAASKANAKIATFWKNHPLFALRSG